MYISGEEVQPALKLKRIYSVGTDSGMISQNFSCYFGFGGGKGKKKGHKHTHTETILCMSFSI